MCIAIHGAHPTHFPLSRAPFMRQKGHLKNTAERTYKRKFKAPADVINLTTRTSSYFWQNKFWINQSTYWLPHNYHIKYLNRHPFFLGIKDCILACCNKYPRSKCWHMICWIGKCTKKTLTLDYASSQQIGTRKHNSLSPFSEFFGPHLPPAITDKWRKTLICYVWTSLWWKHCTMYTVQNDYQQLGNYYTKSTKSLNYHFFFFDIYLVTCCRL